MGVGEKGARVLPMAGLRLGPGQPVESSPEGALRVVGQFFGDLFEERRPGSPEEVDRLLGALGCEGAAGRRVAPEKGKHAQKEDQEEGPVSAEEVRAAIRGGRTRAAPGEDGLTYGFFRAMGHLLAEPLAEVFNWLLGEGRGEMGRFAEGRLVLLPKLGDPTLVNNWRPLIISNVDYRILARVLAARLAARVKNTVHPGQTSAIPGRRMEDSLILLREAFAAAEGGRWQGTVVRLDQSKAFDRVDRGFLWEVMRRKGVPGKLLTWVKSLYEGAIVVPSVGKGWTGPPLKMGRGVRQGCPLSPLLYVLALDPLLWAVQGSKGIRGFRAVEGGERAVAVAHADDVVVLLGAARELGALQEVLDMFERASGARVNPLKSRAYNLRTQGSVALRHRPLGKGGGGQASQPEGSLAEQAEGAVQEVQIFGVPFGTERHSWRSGWRSWETRLRRRLGVWSGWRLDWCQRARFVDTYLFPQATGLASVFPPPQRLIERVEDAVVEFVCGGRSAPVPRAAMWGPVREGGLGVRQPGRWYLAWFAVGNFARWAVQHGSRERGQAGWEAFERSWRGSGWGRRWWEKGETKTEAHRMVGLPEYLAEGARWFRELGLSPEVLKPGMAALTIGDMPGAVRSVYGALGEAARARERVRRDSGSPGIGSEWGPETAREVFNDRMIPVRLWELRWQLFHRILSVQEGWITKDGTGSRCPQPACERRGTAETLEHFLTECPVARELWREMARRWRWPELSRQNWEEVASGSEPRWGWIGPKLREGEARWAVKGSTVRIINLVVVEALRAMREKARRSGRPAVVGRWAGSVERRVRETAAYQRGELSRIKWREVWEWLAGADTPIT